jgi:hypothetical protein
MREPSRGGPRIREPGRGGTRIREPSQGGTWMRVAWEKGYDGVPSRARG